MDFDTKIIHQPLESLSGSNRPLVMPIYQSVKFTADTFEELQEVFTKKEGRYVYSRISNPTVRQLEVLLSQLQGCEDGLCVASGVACISTAFLALLQAGDHMVMFYESYKPSRNLVTKLMKKFGVETTFVSIADIEGFRAAIKPDKTKLVLFESPTNPVTRIANIEEICRTCRENNIISVIDNTFAGFHNHGQYPIDLYLHSLTKFANGHGDSLGGVILGNRSLVDKIREFAIDLGPSLDPQSAYLILRGMRTYTLRYEKQVQNALKIAEFLSSHPQVEEILYPGLESHPDYELACKQMNDSGTIMAIYLSSNAPDIASFMNSLQYFSISASLGSTESLVAPIDIFYGGNLPEEIKPAAHILPNAVRLSIGIENVEDLIADLTQALIVR